ncbi:hypothetical protein PHET_09732, partial [Paragonimus heterotremus]
MVLTTMILFGSFVLCNAFTVTNAEIFQPVQTDNILIEQNENEWGSSVTNRSPWPHTRHEINRSEPTDGSYLQQTVTHEPGIPNNYADVLHHS